MKPGYKMTEVGVIPEDWEVHSLGELTFKVGSGLTPTGGQRVYRNNGRPFIRSQNVGWGSLLLNDVAFIDDLTHATFPDTEICLSDVLLNITGASIGRSALADPRLVGGNVNQHVCIIRSDPQRLVPKFLNLFLLSVYGQRQIDNFQAGGNRQGLNFGQVRSIRLPLPPTKEEQRAIATALSDMDALLDGLDRLIAKKHDLKQAAMQQLLTGQTRLPGFSGEWEVKRLGELGFFLKGRGVKKDDAQSGNLPCIRYGEIYTHHHYYVRSFNSWISGEIASAATLIRQGDILFAGSGETKEEIGKSIAFVCNVEAYAGGDIIILRQVEADALFLGYLLNTPVIASQKASLGQGDAVVHISANALTDIELSLPSRPEQTAIATALSDMDAEIAALEARRAKTRDIKQAMMQELLTGKTRLV